MSQRDGDEVERLRQQLLAAESRAAAVEELLGATESRAAAVLHRAGTAEDRVTHLEQDLRKARQWSGETDFPTFLELCHQHLSLSLCVQTNRSLTTKGSLTSPKGKKHPTRLRPWNDFPQEQQKHFDAAYSLLHPVSMPPPKTFSSPLVITELGRKICRRPLASERDLELYERVAVEENVRDMVGQLINLPDAGDLINGCTELEFENHLNALSENAEEVMDRQKRSAVDQACVFRKVSGHRHLSFVREYKPPHKLTVEYLRAGLRPMEVRKEVVQRITIPCDPDEKLNYHADRLVASAVTQTFEYMIDNGLEYSSIATGLAEVYLRVDEDDPETVYYYLAEPRLDVGQEDEFGFRYPFTAIGRLLAFTLMAMQSSQRSQEWRNEASKLLSVWNEDFEDILHQISPEQRRATPPSSIYKPPSYPVHLGSPCLTRKRARDAQQADAAGLSFHSTSTSSNDSVNEGDREKLAAQSPSRRGTTTRASKRKRKSTQGSTEQHESRRYCTQKCLLGLSSRGSLDPACPNIGQHQHPPGTSIHNIDLTTFHKLLQIQLVGDMDHHCQPLGKQGARGALFKITLVSHGYTFVAKGTVDAFVDDLRHEREVYHRLRPLQGAAVPVCLGNLDLERTYFLDVGVKIIHFLLLSWGGESLHDRTPSVPSAEIEQEKQRSLKDLRRVGVFHRDERLANMLWEESQKRVMLIDFERAICRGEKRSRSPSGALREISPDKKRRTSEVNRKLQQIPSQGKSIRG